MLAVSFRFNVSRTSNAAVSPETVIIPIVSCIIGFPILALLVICCLRRRAKLARDRDRRRNIDLQDHAVSLVRINAIHRFSELTRRYKQHFVLLVVVTNHAARYYHLLCSR